MPKVNPVKQAAPDVLRFGLELLRLPDEALSAFLADCDDDERQMAAMALALPEIESYGRHRRYVADPAGWVRRMLGEHVWSKQTEILDAVLTHRKVAVPACHGPGKSWTAGRAVAHWVATHPSDETLCLTTAPSGDQVKGILWKEINQAFARGQLPGRINLSNWYIGQMQVALGRKPSNTNPAALQGHHAKYLLVIVDEADGVVGPIFEALETLTTSRDAHLLAIGNPDSNFGPFYEACQEDSGWHVIRISAFDTPNFTGERVPADVAENLVSRTWVEERRQKWGETDPRYRSKVLALPPSDNPSGVIPWSSLARAMKGDPDEELPDAPCEVGIDIGAGGDLTVAWARRGARLWRRWQERGSDARVTALSLAVFLKEVQARRAKIDIIGVGHGIKGHLDDLVARGELDCQIIGVNVGKAGRKATPRRPGFRTLRQQMWWETGRELIAEGGMDLRVLRDPEFEDAVTELTAPTWRPEGPNIVVESKDDVRKRIGRSTDDADSLLLAFYDAHSEATSSGAQVARGRLPGVRSRGRSTPGRIPARSITRK